MSFLLAAGRNMALAFSFGFVQVTSPGSPLQLPFQLSFPAGTASSGIRCVSPVLDERRSTGARLGSWMCP